MAAGNNTKEVECTSRTIALQCPHCKAAGEPDWKTWIMVDRKELNCRIFRHGVMREAYERGGVMVQIPPHAPKAQCDWLAANNMIIGCGKPYKVVDVVVEDGAGGKVEQRAVACGYI